MQHGEVKEHNTHRDAVRQPAPRLHPASARLRAEGHRQSAAGGHAGHPRRPTSVRVAFTLKRGGMFKPDYFELVAVDSLGLKLQRHETLGLVGESGLRQDDVRPGADPADRASTAARSIFDGEPIHDKTRARDAAAALAHADRLPGPVLLAQSAHVDRPDHRGRADRQRHRRRTSAERLERVREALRDAGHARQHPVALSA